MAVEVAWHGVHKVDTNERTLNRDLVRVVASNAFHCHTKCHGATCSTLMPCALFDKWKNHVMSLWQTIHDTAPATMDITDQAKTTFIWMSHNHDWNATFQDNNS